MRLTTGTMRDTMRRVGWMLVGSGLRIGLQAIVFVILARVLGATGFGSFAAILALCTLLAPFVELGAYSLVVRDIARGTAVSRAVGDALLVAALTTPLAFGALLLLLLLILPGAPWAVGLALGGAAFVGARLATVFRAVCVACGRPKLIAVMEAGQGAVQLAGVAILYRMNGTVSMWAVLYFGQSLIVGACCLAWLIVRWGRPRCEWGMLRERLRDGVHFAVALSAQSAYGDLDKTVLARVSSFEAVGVYAAAQRVVNVGFVPVTALLGAIYPKFFSAGERGIGHARAVALKLAMPIVAYSIVAGAVLWLFADPIAQLLGGGFGETAGALRGMTPLLLVQSLAYPFADALTGSGNQKVRSAVQVGTLALSLGLNIALDPHFGWRGAVTSGFISQAVALGTFAWGAPRLIGSRVSKG
ncbi:oligosaccharide flippase family protein [Anaeromyxobacter dehalogenans]